MRIFPIVNGPHRGKSIHVTRYVKTATGVEINISHNVPTLAGKQLQWVQTVSSNNSFSVDCKMMTRVDPFGHGGAVNTVSLPSMPGLCKADDLLPFYWTAASRGEPDRAYPMRPVGPLRREAESGAISSPR